MRAKFLVRYRVYIIFITGAIMLAMFGFVILHQAMNHIIGSYDPQMAFFGSYMNVNMIVDSGYFCIGTAFGILIVITLEVLIFSRR